MGDRNTLIGALQNCVKQEPYFKVAWISRHAKKPHSIPVAILLMIMNHMHNHTYNLIMVFDPNAGADLGRGGGANCSSGSLKQGV